MIENVLTRKNATTATKITVKSLISVALVVLSVALPQLVHIAAGASGGMTYLPMYLPVLLGGCLLGVWWGLGIGVLSPIISFLFTNFVLGSAIPVLERLPFMVAELAIFALVSGLFSKKIAQNKWLAFPVLFLAQVCGRVSFITLDAIFQNLLSFNLSTVWAQIQSGVIGLFLQAIIVPLLIILLSRLMKVKDEQNK